ncbi:hypothetical protein PROFUN_02160 [Planoprotostelium fungivorum]|uniref:JmjC domain-containing protein n=1 Tax=Planoprotostelium fungivorum TaxID=1890364 RepID=A0A2P6NZ92_9EUKA|nr:hypothetical protein PROFUN_02160 [Planoprotostelium fungivorum]
MERERSQAIGDDDIEPFITLSEESTDLYAVSYVERISCPDPLEFYRSYVSQNRPDPVNRGSDAISHWPALYRWTNDYLRERMGSEPVTVDVTPNGYGDAVVDDKYFVKPQEINVTFGEFLDLHEKRGGGEDEAIYYVQHQNGNFQSEFQRLSDDIDDELEWASQAFGASPDVVNFWMGEDRSVSSLHKDFYENIYAVVKGTKTFTLLPPTDLPFLYVDRFIGARYSREDSGKFRIKEDEPREEIPWIPVDPDSADLEAYPLFRYAHPVQCEVKEGEVLYLPSLWFHKVAQRGDETGRTIAINYWYNMQFSGNWCYYRFMEKSIEKAKERGYATRGRK